MLLTVYCGNLEVLYRHIAVLALDFNTVLCYPFILKVDKKCPELIGEHHWFKTGPFKMFALDRKICLNNSFFI